MRIGVTGASGYVGRAVVRALAARGHQVAALVRSSEAIPGARPPLGAGRAVLGDLEDAASLAAFAAGLDACVHAAAYVHRRYDSPGARAACFAVNEGGTRALIAALASGGSRPRLAFVSSTAVYGDRPREAREADPPSPANAYGESKLAAERAVLEADAAGTLVGCVLRPCVVIGTGAPGNAARLASLVRKRPIPLVRGGANRKSVVHVDDLAAAIVRAIEAGEDAPSRVWNVAGGSVTVREMVEAIARGIGVRPRWLAAPGPLFDAGAALASTLSRASGGRLPDLGRSLDVFAGTATVDASAIARDLGATFRDSLAAIEAAAREDAARA